MVLKLFPAAPLGQAPKQTPAPLKMPKTNLATSPQDILNKLSPTQRQIIGRIRRTGACSRNELRQFFHITPETISRLIGPLMDKKVLLSKTHVSLQGSRRNALRINPGFMCAFGVEMGFTEMRMGLVDLGGAIIERAPIHPIAQLEPSDCAAIILDAYGKAARQRPELNIAGIGIAYTGLIAPDNNHIERRYPLSRKWPSFPLVDALRKGCGGGSVALCPDTSAALLAEMRYGQARHCEDALLVLMVDGIGLAMLSNGIIHLGRAGEGCEFGHLRVNTDGAYCYCGSTGCLESLASSWAILRNAQNRLENGVVSHELTRAEAPSLTMHKISEAAIKSEVFARGILAEAGQMIGKTLANAANLLYPTKAILAGILAENEAFGPLIQGLRLGVQNGLHQVRAPGATEIACAALGRDGVLVGGAAWLLEQIMPAYPHQVVSRGKVYDEQGDEH